VKIMSNLDIAERRLPQDGRIETKVGNKDIELRVSTFPTIYGENVVMRILDRSTALIGLEELGFTKDKLEQFERIISLPYGILLVTGPTGSGKTSTLYAALNKINSVEDNIITIEDPVEYRLEGIRQTQVNPKAGLTFVNGLRFMLRQDPDIMMIGEVRDLETAELAVRAALTGHFVFTTLHTNDAPGALTRLNDMGVAKFLISSSVIGALAQRLVRKLCTKCKEAYTPEEGILKTFNLDGSSKKYTFYKAKGCKHCIGTGYKGRIGIFELLEVTETIQHMILQGVSLLDIKKEAIKAGMRTLREDGIQKVVSGITSVSEIVQVT